MFRWPRCRAFNALSWARRCAHSGRRSEEIRIPDHIMKSAIACDRRSPLRGAEGGTDTRRSGAAVVTHQRARDCAASRRRWLGMTSWQDARSRHPAGGSEGALEVAGAQRNHRRARGAVA